MMRLRKGAALISLFLSVSMLACWVRSIRHYDVIAYGSGNVVFWTLSTHVHGLKLSRENSISPMGWLTFYVHPRGWSMASFCWDIPQELDPSPANTFDNVTSSSIFITLESAANSSAGFAFHFGTSADRFTSVDLPFWFLAAVFSLWPIRELIAARRRGYRKRNCHCLSCGYDLRADVSGVCPECGTAIP